jgi:hypothetical protein
MQEMRSKTPNGGRHLLVLYVRAEIIYMVKNNGSGWLRWLLKQGGVIWPKQIIDVGPKVTMQRGVIWLRFLRFFTARWEKERAKRAREKRAGA